MLTTAGGVLLSFSRFCSAMKPPKLTFVSEQEISSMVALGAPALAYSASSVASSSASPPTAPGSLQLFGPVKEKGCTCCSVPEVKEDSPNVERKFVQSSVVNRSVSSTTTTVCPCPDVPALNSGVKL